MLNTFSLDGRSALVTGGSRGIGRMIAEGFLAHGAKVYISARKSSACIAAAEEMSRGGAECIAVVKDISTLDGAKALADEVCKRENGSLDILVNNAGAAWAAEFEEFPELGWDKVVDLNMKTPFFLTKFLFPSLRAAASADRPSKVINISSIDGIGLNSLESYSYHASKAGLIHLTRRMAARLARDNILVNAISPGAFESEMNRVARDKPELLTKHIPTGRIGRMEDMASAAIYLAARSGDYVAGLTLVVDGGVTLARYPHVSFTD